MATTRFEKARIAAVVGVIPPDERRIDDEVEAYGGDLAQIARIKKAIGLDRRRVVAPGVTTLDLCGWGVAELFRRTALRPEGVDALVFVTQTPDHWQPSNAALLHGRLGLSPGCAALDVNLGCSGYVYALWLAYMMVEGGGCRDVVVCAGDTISRQVGPGDRSVAPLFGDGGSATWVTRAAGPTPSHFALHTDGTGWRAIHVPAGGFRQPWSAAAEVPERDADGNLRAPVNLHMSGGDVFNFSLRVEPAALQELAALAGRPLEDLDYVFFHQANRYILGNIARRLKLPREKVPDGVVEKYGNQSSASIPVVIADTLEGRAGGVRTVALSGFGVGLSWASAWMELGPLEACANLVFPGWPPGGAGAA